MTTNESTSSSPQVLVQLNALRRPVAQRSEPERDLAVATGVHANRNAYKWKRPAQRPHNLPEDVELVDLVESSCRGDALDKSRAKLAGLFGTWRDSVFKQEHSNAHNAAILCFSYRVLDAVGKKAEADQVVEILGSFGPIDWGPAPVEMHLLFDWAREHLRDTLTLNWKLRGAGTR